MPLRTGAAAVALITSAVRDGRLTPGSARQWAYRVRQGEDISVIRAMADMPSREVLGARAMNALVSDLAGILTELGAAPPATPGPPKDEYDACMATRMGTAAPPRWRPPPAGWTR